MKQRKSFTLIELMVVIAIIAVLAAVVAPQVFRQVAKGRNSSVESFYNTVKIAATAYFSDIGAWPRTCTPAGPPACNTDTGLGGINGGFITTGTNTAWDGPYLDRWPLATGNPWGGTYNWNTVTGIQFGPAPAASQRWISITLVPRSAAQRIDRDKDGALSGTSGMVRYPAGDPVTMTMLVSRDGPVN